YGSPRVHAELKSRGHDCCVNTVAKLMRDNDVRAKTARKFRCTTDSNHDLPVAENLLDRQFDPEAANAAWGAGITPVPTRAGWPWWRTLPTPGPGRGGCTWPPSRTCSRGGWWAGRWPTASRAAWSLRRWRWRWSGGGRGRACWPTPTAAASMPATTISGCWHGT